jgi:citrate synthase
MHESLRRFSDIDNLDQVNIDGINIAGHGEVVPVPAVPPEHRALGAAEAAARLGVKRQTLYAYVSRGMLPRTVAADGRTSLFDADEIDRFARTRRGDGGEDGQLRTLLSSTITRIDDDGLLVRGKDLIDLVDEGASFVDVVELLWDGQPGEAWPGSAEVCARGAVPGAAHLADALRSSLLDELRIVVALLSAGDPLRHDLSDRSIRSVGRRLVTAMAVGLSGPSGATGTGHEPDLVEQLWRRLTSVGPEPAERAALDAALALLVDHGLAGSTFAARIAASVRADPYSAVSAALGVLGGPLHGAASGAVHELFLDAERSGDAAAAVGAARRRLGSFPGFGHRVYQRQDPRYGALMTMVETAWAGDRRLETVRRVRELVGERSDALANVDLALGALTFLAGMPVDAGEVVFAIGRTAGWLAHAQEEYGETPLRFRARARYAGRSSPHPGAADREP